MLPGVYRVYDANNHLIYVGKAKNLRRRLSQYRNAKRIKKHLKMRTVVTNADRIEYEVCASELDALLLETRLIQDHRPKWNVAGAFYFLYPLIGLQVRDGNAYFCYTTRPENHPTFRFHGAFRSRHLTGGAFFSLMKLLPYVGHKIPRKAILKAGIYTESKDPTYIFGFRQIREDWLLDLERFFKGESLSALENLVLGLLDHSTALRNREEVQDQLNDLKRFWKHEAKWLSLVRTRTGFERYPVPQKERDFIFLRHQVAAKDLKSRKRNLNLPKKKAVESSL